MWDNIFFSEQESYSTWKVAVYPGAVNSGTQITTDRPLSSHNSATDVVRTLLQDLSSSPRKSLRNMAFGVFSSYFAPTTLVCYHNTKLLLLQSSSDQLGPLWEPEVTWCEMYLYGLCSKSGFTSILWKFPYGATRKHIAWFDFQFGLIFLGKSMRNFKPLFIFSVIHLKHY